MRNTAMFKLYDAHRLIFQRLLEFGKFVVVGILATATHFLAAIMALSFVGKFSANMYGYCVAVFVSYVGHRYFTFGQSGHKQNHTIQILKFVLVSLSAVAMSQVVLFLVGLFEVSEEVALGVAVLVVPPYTFALFRLWVFREKKM